MKMKLFIAILFSVFIRDGLFSQTKSYSANLTKPLSVYLSWAAHDEISDVVPLTEELAMREFDALLKMRKQGVQFDCYILDAFWYDKNGGYREFKKEGWPNGPDRWIKSCIDNNIKPGLWLSVSVTGWNPNPWMITKPEWKNSAGGQLNQAFSMHTGGYLPYFIETMQQWFNKGIRVFKFDFAEFDAGTSADFKLFTKQEIIRKNEEAFIDALKLFRLKNPDVIFLAYNGFGGENKTTSVNFSKTVELKWLDVFESLYCGDPRPADVPCMNFWRSKDIYSDHMVFQYLFNGIPLSRIDNCGFMVGNTGTCYFRKKQAWKGMLILSAARGGLMNTYYGNLELFTDTEARWFAKTQQLFFGLQEFGRFETFGAIPGSAKPYGFIALNQNGALYTVVNPSQTIQTFELPIKGFNNYSLLFTDAGFKPKFLENKITLGPEQMALVGSGSFTDKKFDLGIQEDVVIPSFIAPLQVTLINTGKNTVEGTLSYSGINDLRLIFKQSDNNGNPLRVTGNSPPDGIFMAKLLTIKATQEGKELPIKIQYDKQIWSGISWAVAEIPNASINKTLPINIQYTDADKRECIITGNVYEIAY